jgi:formylglycine-generating enzyme required for sulfatase activity
MQLPALMFIMLLCLVGWGGPAAADDIPLGPPEPIKPMEMVLVKGGCYEMGDTFGDGGNNEKPVHHVCVKDFYLGKYVVTQMQYTMDMAINPSLESVCGMTCPVENVSWNDVQEYIKKLSGRTGNPYRLPTEAEWEYAARSGGKDEKWAGTSNENELGEHAWFYNNSHFQSHPVGGKKPNELGLYDMTGNVWEWMSDYYDDGYYAKSPADEPTGAETGQKRALRGGYWGDFPSWVRITRRIGLDPAAKAAGYGVRLVLPAQ